MNVGAVVRGLAKLDVSARLRAAAGRLLNADSLKRHSTSFLAAVRSLTTESTDPWPAKGDRVKADTRKPA
ncbi:MAG: hypothetical protein NVSMB55_22550 [Mycobacteriales bacterium]